MAPTDAFSLLSRLSFPWTRRGEAHPGPGRIARLADSLSALQVAAGAWLLSTFVASPAFFAWTWQGITEKSRAADFLKLCAWPFDRDLTEPVMAYRITVPVVAWLLQLPPVLALILPYLVHVAFLAVCFVALERRADRETALLGTVMISLSFALFWSNWHPGFTDTATHLAVGMLMLTTAWHWVVPLVLLGLFNDERMLLALPFVVGWHLYPADQRNAWPRTIRLLAALVSAVAAYLLMRHCLSIGVIGPGIGEPEVYRAMVQQSMGYRPHLGSWAVWALNVFLSFRWAWLLVLLLIWHLLSRRERGAAVLVFVFLGAGVLASALVADVSRSVGFLFPAWMLAIVALHREMAEKTVRLLKWLVVALMITPVFFTFENFHVHWFRPLPLVLLRCFTGADPVHWLAGLSS